MKVKIENYNSVYWPVEWYSIKHFQAVRGCVLEKSPRNFPAACFAFKLGYSSFLIESETGRFRSCVLSGACQDPK